MRIRSRTFLSLTALFAASLLVAAGCASDDATTTTTTTDEPSGDTRAAQVDDRRDRDDDAATNEATAKAGATSRSDAMRPRGEDGLRVAAQAAQIVAKDSEFGTVLFDANGQVVYAFEADRRNTSNCTSEECVTAWPPVLTRDAPTAGKGARANLLGTIRRDDGSMQVTYAGRPLYFYEHEAPGEIKCHEVDIHGGLWWVVAPDGVPVGT